MEIVWYRLDESEKAPASHAIMSIFLDFFLFFFSFFS